MKNLFDIASLRSLTCLLIVVVGMVSLSSCSKPAAPKPYGYFRIAIPQAAYEEVTYGPYTFALSRNAEIRTRQEQGEQYWMDIVYPTLNTSIHCSYKAIEPRRKDAKAADASLAAMTADALEFVYKHAQKATAIPEQAFANDEERVYGVYFELYGNTASPCQFFLTDSTHHFFRGAVYANCRPNADSLAPVYQYIEQDVRVLMESFRWTK